MSHRHIKTNISKCRTCHLSSQDCRCDSSWESSSTDECGTGKLTLFYDDFGCGFMPERVGSPYIYFSAPGTALTSANDAFGGVTAQCELLTINSTPFKFTDPSGLDHVKFLVYQKSPYNAPKKGAEIVYEGVISVEQTGLGSIPQVLQAVNGSLVGVNNVNSDIRLAAGAFNCIDPETLMVFDFLISNEDIYAFYERLPFNRTEFGGPGPNYIAYSHAIPVAKRNVSNPGNDFVKLAIAYNYKENYVRWIVNDMEVFRVNRIGYPLERKYRILEHNTVGQISAPAQLIRPKQLQYGFGTFSLMDMYNPQNPGQLNNAALVNLTLGGILPDVNPIVTNVNGTTIAPTFLSPYLPGGFPGFPENGTNFGQGAILRIKYLTVYLLAPDETIRKFPDLYDCKHEVLLSRCHQNSFNGVNASDDLNVEKCKGRIDDCDNCEEYDEKCDCLFPDGHRGICHHIKRKKHKCQYYVPHNKKIQCSKMIQNMVNQGRQ